MAEEEKVKKTDEKEKITKKTETAKKTPKPQKKPADSSKKTEVKDLPPPPTPKKAGTRKDKTGAQKPEPKPKAETKEPSKTKPAAKKETPKEGEGDDEIEIVEEEESEYEAKIKPKLGKDIKHELEIRRTIKRKTPEFKQQEWFRYKRISPSWRKPLGIHSKMRKHKGYRPNVVSVGYGSPSKARSLHPSGFEEVMVFNTQDLEKVNPKSQAARVGHSVGTRKRIEIEKAAKKKGIRVLNPRRL